MENRSSNMRTPGEAALAAIGGVLQLYLALNSAKTHEDFFNQYRRMQDEGVTGDELITAWHEDQPSEEFPHSMKIAMAFCIQSIKAFRDGRKDEAWAYACDTAIWTGNTLAHAQSILSPNQRSELSENARKAALARHAENYEIANQIMEWFKDNHGSYSSLDAAAAAAQKIAPTSFRTARKWVGKANKKYALQAGRKVAKQK